jgi:hypothetical protein
MKAIIVAGLTIFFAFSLISPSVHAQKVTAAKIVFDTYSPRGDDKDPDTNVTVELRTKEGTEYKRLIAKKEKFDGDKKYKDPSRNEKELDIQGSLTRQDIDGVKVYIHMEPNGNDTWRFHYKIQIQFDNGTILEKGEDGIELTQDSKTHEHVF